MPDARQPIELLPKQPVERRHIGRQNMQEIISLARRRMTAPDQRMAAHGGLKRIEALDIDRHLHESLQPETEPGRIEKRPVSPDHTRFLQRFYALPAWRLAETGQIGKRSKGEAGIGLQRGNDLTI